MFVDKYVVDIKNKNYGYYDDCGLWKLWQDGLNINPTWEYVDDSGTGINESAPPILKYKDSGEYTGKYSLSDLFGLSYQDNFLKFNQCETDSELIIDVKLSGYKKEDIDITVEDDNLKVRAKIVSEKEYKSNGYVSKQTIMSEVEKSLFVDKNKFDTNNVVAKYQDGILCIMINKVEQKDVKSKKVEIS